MEKFSKNSIAIVLSIFSIFVIFGLAGPIAARATTTPSLGTAATYGILTGTFNYNVGLTTITGVVGTAALGYAGVAPGAGASLTVTGTTQVNNLAWSTAGTDQSTALTALAIQACGNGTAISGYTFADGAIDLATDTTHGTIRHYSPGVYCVTGAMSIGTAGIVLDSAGTYIFRSTGAFDTVTGSIISSGASACNVFWTPGAATTLAANTTFVGTIIDNAGITIGNTVLWEGRALAYAAGSGVVTADTDTITVPTCAASTVTLTLVKTITNDNGGARPLADFQLTATGPTTITGVSGTAAVTAATVTAGTYTLSETTQSDYTAGLWSCTNGIAVNGSSQITLSAGQSTVCTINNNDIAPALHLRKTVDNTGGGAALNTAWTLTATGALGSPTNLTGTTPVDSGATFKADTYTLAESGGPTGYAASSWSCVKNGSTPVSGASVMLGLGDTATCTITNTYIPPGSASLTVTKTVTNDNGGTKVIADFPLFIDGMSVTSGAASTTSTGLHTVSETADSGYTATIGGDCVTNGTITLTAGQTKSCTITNNDIAPQLVVTKVVTNDNGGAKEIADFPLFIDGMSVTSGVASTTAAGSHKISETTDPGYTSTISGQCAADGTITLLPGGVLNSCTITNDDIAPAAISHSSGGSSRWTPPVPPLIDVVKVPSPLALPKGPGPVAYTYTLRNIGTVPVTNITMAGDTCSPITLVSGDTNSDAKLDVNETWVYRCSTTLSATHTNTVTATGWANGISAVDIASATVVVGAPVIPPLIHVTKVPSVLALPASGGAVTYAYAVTNPGTAPLSDVSITDDKCTGLPGRVLGHPGDLNKNDLLESNETWSFTCQSKLAKTTTNTGMAEGSANGLMARDFAIATVVVSKAITVPVKTAVVAVPKLPNAGFAPLEENTFRNIIIPAGILIILFSLAVVSRLRRPALPKR